MSTYKNFTRSLLYLVALSSIAPAALSCESHPSKAGLARIDLDALVSGNLAARELNLQQAATEVMAITNVRIFDGTALLQPTTIIINGTRISKICSGASPSDCPSLDTFNIYDACGKTLLPGLIDSHSHPLNVGDLTNMTAFGITTAVIANCVTPELCTSLSNQPGLASTVPASFVATTPNSTVGLVVGTNNPNLITSISQIPDWVANQVAGGAQFIKIIGSAPSPGLDQEAQTLLVQAAHASDRQVMQHASSYSSFEQALIAGSDQIHHSTLDVELDDRLVAMFQKSGTVACPTLTMMRAIVNAHIGNATFPPAIATTSKLLQAGVRIIVGTDSNTQPAAPAMVPFGSSIHDELENLVEAGMSPVDALNAATVVPASVWGWSDKGAIKEGMLADMVLIDGDPTVNLSVSRNIIKVWVGGLEFTNGKQGT